MASAFPRRWCVVCGKDLVTCKAYTSLKGKLELLSLLSECVKDDISLNASQNACSVCHRKIMKLKSGKELEDEIVKLYSNTKTSMEKENVNPELQHATPKYGPNHFSRLSRGGRGRVYYLRVPRWDSR